MLLDSDFGNDVDDVFALQMLINYEKQGAVDLLGIGVVKSTPMALDFARSYYGKFGCGDPDFGMVSDGPNPDDGAYMRPTLYAAFDSITTSPAPEAWQMMRDRLIQAPDSSVTVIAIGPLTNMARLVDNAPDIVADKVKALYVMGGAYTAGLGEEFNILQDLDAASIVFTKWPGDIIASGWEIGDAYQIPYSMVKETYAAGHPLRVAFEHYRPLPYNSPAWDLTAVLDAVEPDSLWFGHSEPGKIVMDSIGHTYFTPTPGGKHRILTVNGKDVVSVLIDRAQP